MEHIELKGPGTVTYSRKPTALEMKLGYGARHYLTIEKELVRKIKWRPEKMVYPYGWVKVLLFIKTNNYVI